MQLARQKQVLAKVVYHKLCDPDHKKLRTLVDDGELQHVNNGYCSLLEPRSICQAVRRMDRRPQSGHLRRRPLHQAHRLHVRRPAEDSRLHRPARHRRPGDGPTWDSTQLRLIYEYPDGREAAFDIHTSWVTPDNFPGYVEQEVQFRFDNGVWNGHSRKRGIEFTVEGRTPTLLKTTSTTTTTARSSSRGATGRSAATASRCSSGSSRKSPTSNSAAAPIAETSAWKTCGHFATTISPRTGGRRRRAGDGGDPRPAADGTPDGVVRISSGRADDAASARPVRTASPVSEIDHGD